MIGLVACRHSLVQALQHALLGLSCPVVGSATCTVRAVMACVGYWGNAEGVCGIALSGLSWPGARPCAPSGRGAVSGGERLDECCRVGGLEGSDSCWVVLCRVDPGLGRFGQVGIRGLPGRRLPGR